MYTIKLLVPQLPDAEALLPKLKRIDQARHYTNFGPLSRQLEAYFCQSLKTPHAVCLSSCTIGLELALAALQLPEGARVALPSFTFPATATAIFRNRLTPVFFDIDPITGLLSPDVVARHARRLDIAAVMPVCLFGRGYERKDWEHFVSSKKIPVVLDAAGAIAHQSGDVGSATVFSLHATKPLSAGEGGVLATSDADLADRVRSLSNFGLSEMGMVSGVGTNGKMSEYHAAVCLSSIESWPQSLRMRQRLRREYADALSRFAPNVSIAHGDGVGGNFSIRLNRPITTDDVGHLSLAGIETRRWYYPPLHKHELFANIESAQPLTGTESLASRLLGIPYHLSLTTTNIEQVARSLGQLPH